MLIFFLNNSKVGFRGLSTFFPPFSLSQPGDKRHQFVPGVTVSSTVCLLNLVCTEECNCLSCKSPMVLHPFATPMDKRKMH